MKFTITLILFLAAVIYSCSPTSTTETTAESTDTVAVDPTATFSLWLELGVREDAKDKAKYLTSIYLGEHVTLTGDSAMDGTNLWNKIVMTDGKSGWVRADFLAKRKVPAAFLGETNIFKRPDRAAITDHMFPSVDFVAASLPLNGWVHIRGKRAGDKWFTEGYVEEGNLTYDKNEVEFAILNKRMNESENETVRDAIMAQIQSTPELQTTEFYRMMYYTGPAGDGEVEGDEEEVQETDQDVATGDPYAIAGPPYAVADVPDLIDSGEGKILNIFGKSEYWYVYNEEKYLLRETNAEAILQTTLFYHCTEQYLGTIQTIKDKVIEVIPGDGYVPQ